MLTTFKRGSLEATILYFKPLENFKEPCSNEFIF